MTKSNQSSGHSEEERIAFLLSEHDKANERIEKLLMELSIHKNHLANFD